MITCQRCGKHPATAYFTQTVNGKTTQLALCPACVAELGYSSLSGMNLGHLFGSILGNAFPTVSETDQKRCPGCGCSFQEIARTGKVGCADCYTTFYDRLLPNLERIHGKVKHEGKLSSTAAPRERTEYEIKQLKRQLSQAIEKQEFEEAARLRDQIAELEGGKDHE